MGRMGRMGLNSARRRVVVTGMGVVTPIGIGVEEFWKNSLCGKSGGGKITTFDAAKYDTKIACEVKGFKPLDFIDKKSTQRMDFLSIKSRGDRKSTRLNSSHGY